MNLIVLTVKATWVKHSKVAGGKMVLKDPSGVKLIRKSKNDSGKEFFWCSRTRDLKCPVRVTLDTASDSITSIRGEHNRDSDILKEWVKEKTKEVVAAAVANPSVAPRTAFKDLTNHVLSSADTSPAVAVLPKQRQWPGPSS